MPLMACQITIAAAAASGRMSVTDMDGLQPCGASGRNRLPGMITAHSAARMLW